MHVYYSFSFFFKSSTIEFYFNKKKTKRERKFCGERPFFVSKNISDAICGRDMSVDSSDVDKLIATIKVGTLLLERSEH